MILGNSSKPRLRASIACAGCRTRRTKCIIGSGQTACDRCLRLAKTCVLRDDDERKRPVTKAQVQALVRRIGTLEQRLSEAGLAVPAAADAAVAEVAVADDGEGPSRWPSSTAAAAAADAPSPCDPDAGTRRAHTATCSLLAGIPFAAHDHLLSQFWACYNTVVHVVHRGAFEWDGGCIERDAATGGTWIGRRDTPSATLSSATAPESSPSEKADHAPPCYYSPFLHVCMLAVGYRYADRSKPAVQAFATPDGASLLHAEARRLAAHELQAPGGLPSVQALLLLSDLEAGVGRYRTGWLYAGMASRLVVDLGLHRQDGGGCGGGGGLRDTVGDGTTSLLPSPSLSSSSLPPASPPLAGPGSALPPLDADVRRTVLWACVVLDRCWGLFLGRPTSIKPAPDLAGPLRRGSGDSRRHRLQGALPMGAAMRFETAIYEALIQLTDMAAKLTDLSNSDTASYNPADPGAYSDVRGLHRALRLWHRRLPAPLQWTPANVARRPPPAFFHLHQQYHALYILLYRPFLAGDGGAEETGAEDMAIDPSLETTPSVSTVSPQPDDADDEDADSDADTAGRTTTVTDVVALARRTCVAHAVAVARVCAAFAARFAPGTLFVMTGLQHAATAAFALVEGFWRGSADTDTETLLHLQRLAAVLHAHAGVYYPARAMVGRLLRVLGEYRAREAAMRRAQAQPRAQAHDESLIHRTAEAAAALPSPCWGPAAATAPAFLPMKAPLLPQDLAVQSEQDQHRHLSLQSPDWAVPTSAPASAPAATAGYDNAHDAAIWDSIMTMLSQPVDDAGGWGRLA